MTNAHLLGLPLHPNSVKLGRLTTNLQRPHTHFKDPFPERPSDTEILTTNHNGFRDSRKFNKQSRRKLGIRFLAHLSFSKSGEGSATISAQQTTTQELMNSGEWFDDACLQPKTREWLEKAAKAKLCVYLITGFRTARDAKIISACSGAGGLGGAAAPYSMASLTPSLASWVLLPHAMISQLTVGTDDRWGEGNDMEFTAEGEQVFAVLYREVRLGRFSKDVDKMVLKGEKWGSIWDWGSIATDGGFPIPADLIVHAGSNPLPGEVKPQGQVSAVELEEKEEELDTREEELDTREEELDTREEELDTREDGLV